MGSRVEEERAEAYAEQQRLMKAAEKQRSEKSSQEFQKRLQQNRDTATAPGAKAAQSRGELPGRSGPQARTPAQALLVKQGILDNARMAKMQQEGVVRSETQRTQSQGRDKELTVDRDTKSTREFQRTEEKRLERQENERLVAISRDDAQKGGGGGGSQQQGAQSDAGGGDQEAARRMLASGMAGAPMASGAPAAAQSAPTGAAAGPTPPDTAQLVQELVKRISAFVNSKGLGEAYIELQQGVLSGAVLHVAANQEGVALRVQTGDANVARLFRAGQTGHELTNALLSKGIKLNRLEVNSQKVLG